LDQNSGKCHHLATYKTNCHELIATDQQHVPFMDRENSHHQVGITR